jgi:hypothetical protein
MYVCNFVQTLFLLITENPLSLQSICRLKIRKFMGRSGLPLICTLDIPQVLRNFLMYRDIPQVNQCITTLNLELSRSMMTKWINICSNKETVNIYLEDKVNLLNYWHKLIPLLWISNTVTRLQCIVKKSWLACSLCYVAVEVLWNRWENDQNDEIFGCVHGILEDTIPVSLITWPCSLVCL